MIASKCGIPWDSKDWPAGKGNFHFHANDEGLSSAESKYRFYRYLNPDSIKREVEDSLRRLGTDYLDILLTHAQEDTTPIADTMGALEELRAAGKVRAVGCSNVSLDQLHEYCRAGTLDVDQERFNLIDQHVRQAGIIDSCEKMRVSFFAYSPLEHGLLSGKLRPDQEYPEHDFRRTSRQFSPESVQRMNDTLARLRPLAEKYSATVAQVIVAWTIAQTERCHALCGIRGEAHVRENAVAGISFSIRTTAARLNRSLNRARSYYPRQKESTPILIPRLVLPPIVNGPVRLGPSGRAKGHARLE